MLEAPEWITTDISWGRRTLNKESDQFRLMHSPEIVFDIWLSLDKINLIPEFLSLYLYRSFSAM